MIYSLTWIKESWNGYISVKQIEFRTKNIIIVKKGHFIITHIDEESSVGQKNPNVYALKHKASKYLKQKVMEVKKNSGL